MNLLERDGLTIRFRLAEFFALKELKALLTSKYPPELLDTEFFNEMNAFDKQFLKEHWNTFDLFKPVFKFNNEIPRYQGFILYEVKSFLGNSVRKRKFNEGEKPKINLTSNQMKFLSGCGDRKIPFRFFIVYFEEGWKLIYNNVGADEVEIRLSKSSQPYRNLIKKIRASKLNQFWHDLFPKYVLYKTDLDEIESMNNTLEESVSELVSTPLSDVEKKLLSGDHKFLNKEFDPLDLRREDAKLYRKKKQ